MNSAPARPWQGRRPARLPERAFTRSHRGSAGRAGAPSMPGGGRQGSHALASADPHAPQLCAGQILPTSDHDTESDTMALNDPNWGRRGGDGPPDLDELWNRLRQKLSALFGGRGGGRGGPGRGRGQAVPVRGPGPDRPGIPDLGCERLLHRRRQPARRGAALRQVRADHAAGPAVASALSHRVGGDRQPEPGAHGGGGLPQQRQEQGAQRVADADR